MSDKLLKEKQTIKKKTPYFIRTSGITKVRLKGSGWRRPKGITNKMRLQEHGKRRIVKAGYGTPAELRGVSVIDGKTNVIVANVNDLKKVGKMQKALIASTVGLKKKIQIIEEAKKQKIEVANITENTINKKMSEINSKKQEQTSKKEERSKKKKEAEKKKEKASKKEEKSENEEESKKEEKKEKDKVLIHKD